jgi:hypothetical protein
MLKFDFVWDNYWGIYLDHKLKKKKKGEIKDNCHGSWRRNKTKKGATTLYYINWSKRKISLFSAMESSIEEVEGKSLFYIFSDIKCNINQ